MKILPPVLVVILLIVMWALRYLAPGPVIAPYPWNYLGLLPLVGGLALTLSGALLFRRRHTNIKTFDPPTLLVTDGPFRFTRNPMYLGFSLFLAGAGIMFGTMTPLIVALSFILIADRWYIPFEERAMSQQFGATYEQYCQRTRRWI